MPKIEELKAWAGEHQESCELSNHPEYREFNAECTCDVPLKQKLVAEIEAWRRMDDAPAKSLEEESAWCDARKARKDLEDA